MRNGSRSARNSRLLGRHCVPARENDLAVAMLDLDQARVCAGDKRFGM
jgi:hypothetical protein